MEVKNGEPIYRFIHNDGTVFVCDSHLREPQKDLYQTILHYGFPCPTAYKLKDEEKTLYRWHWQFYGDIRTQPVIVIVYSNSYDDLRSLSFLSYKGATYKELTKRDKVYQQAKQLIQSTKDPLGYYHVNGRTLYNLWEHDIFVIASQLESAIYTVTQAVVTNGRPKEEVSEPAQPQEAGAEDENSEPVQQNADSEQPV